MLFDVGTAMSRTKSFYHESGKASSNHGGARLGGRVESSSGLRVNADIESKQECFGMMTTGVNTTPQLPTA